jgi:hypothetical protein
MEVNTHFISQNVAPNKSFQIGVYSKDGKKKGHIPLGSLVLPNDLGKKLYSFGALSDIHLYAGDADADFQRALTYFTQTEKVDFTCICGDLTNFGRVDEYQHYKAMVDAYSPNTPVYAISGNHDATDAYEPQGGTPALTLTYDGITPYTGKPLYYTFSQGNDLFVMMGMRRWDYGYVNDDPFSVEELQWLYDTLEANREKRCFVFQHALRFDGCGRPYGGSPTGNLLNCTQGEVFKSIVSHYPNVIWFHGHSHTRFESQEDNDIANYDHKFGCHSIHIPSLATPKDYDGSAYFGVIAESEGYVVDVYANHIVLRGRDFAEGKFFPIATYCLDTTFTAVGAGTFTDSTGMIETYS